MVLQKAAPFGEVAVRETNRQKGDKLTTIGLPFSPVRGTIIKSTIVSMRNVGN